MAFDGLKSLSRRLGNPKEALERRRRADRNLRFAFQHTEEWRNEHSNCWIAVYGEQLISVDESREGLLEALISKREKVPLGEVYIDFLDKEKSALLL